ncbi:hypothetical protein [Dyadobacter psychrophilus]|uniref:Uncharacterized protein n=1 Tax=Dyadobacter psychrophilus TaxID=651661 RepID=A0A1T5DX47_9BACT|nr:hypothetical protein [Dyadobacter psychrophilus]SKB76169.1 hypothetical protein SAMN05660293_01971 [Dyadobacter psychrophilus]
MNPYDDDDDDLFDDDLPGNYPAEEDIFRQGLIDSDIDPEDISKVKSEIELESDDWNEKSFDDDLVGDDLDVPGSEYDDDDEMIGREDEENNYYSIGGDNHDSLEENQGD